MNVKNLRLNHFEPRKKASIYCMRWIRNSCACVVLNSALPFVKTYDLYKVKKEKTCKFTMVIAWRKQAGAKGFFRHEVELGHGIGLSTTIAYVHPQNLRKKKDVVYGLLFLLHDSADRRVTNPVRNPNSRRPKFVSNPDFNPYHVV